MKKRNSCIELLRICCMLMIIGGHIIMAHRMSFDMMDADSIISLFLRGAFAVAVNTFVLISGYFGINFKWQRLVKLDIQTVFYSVMLLMVAIMLGWHTIEIKKDFLLLFPILSKQYWFITCYAVLYLISPLLNQWSNTLEKKRYERLLVIGFFIIYVWPTISFLFNASQFVNDAGYGIINFIYLYMLAQYIHHLYVDKYSTRIYWVGYFCSMMLLFLVQFGLSCLLGFEFTSWISYNTIFILGGSICLFLAFRKMHFASSWINALAKPCLAVYLIHFHPYIWGNFCEIIGIQSFYGWRYLMLIVLFPIVIYLACAFLESIRIFLFCKIEDSLILFMEKRMKVSSTSS